MRLRDLPYDLRRPAHSFGHTRCYEKAKAAWKRERARRVRRQATLDREANKKEAPER